MPAHVNIATELNWESTVELGHFSVFLNKLSATNVSWLLTIRDTTVYQKRNTTGSQIRWNRQTEFLPGDKHNNQFETVKTFYLYTFLV